MPRGGRRQGAGRPKGTGKYGEVTKALRVPISMIGRIVAFIERKALSLPIYSTKSQAKHPGPSDDIPAERFDLLDCLIPNPSAAFLIRMKGEAMTGIGIFDKDLLLVDPSVEPKHGQVVVAVVDGAFTVRRWSVKNDKIELKSENPKFQTIKITDPANLNLWGVVHHVVRSV